MHVEFPATAGSLLAHPAVDAIWMAAARDLGWRVERSAAAYATSDGAGTLRIGVPETLDADDSLAQLIFHELCHGLVAGPAGWTRSDWGLENGDPGPRDVAGEHACLRLQIHLSEPFGLRGAMAPTTEYRAYHDAVVGDPLGDPADDASAQAVILAREAIARPESRPWLDALRSALRATRVWLDARAAEAAAARERHAVGFPYGDTNETCGSCAWRYLGGPGRPVERCRQSAAGDGIGLRTSSDSRACVRWERALDCQSCGACCREAYHSVTVAVRDPVVWKQPDLIVRLGPRFEIRRAGDRCAALEVSTAAGLDSPRGGSARTYACRIYDDRPRPCREFEAGGRHCLVARRRVGLSA